MTTDPLTEALEGAHAAQLRGIEELRTIRERNTQRKAERAAAQAVEDEEQAHAEAAFAQAEREAHRVQVLEEHHARHQAAMNDYAPLAATADALLDELTQAANDIVALCASAIMAERKRDAAGKTLTAAYQSLTQLDSSASHVRIFGLRLHHPKMTEPLGLITIAAMLTDARLSNERETAKALVEKRAPNPNVIVNVTK